jgi:formylglycine-generating enzyme required for sulfatase activity
MADVGAGEKLKVFISYSRRDSAAFADELVAGLELSGFAPFLDRHDIAAGEDWEARLGGLIAQSDTVVFVVSPEAVKSDRCTWEVDRTIELSKRLLPVIFKSVSDHDIPENLRRLQFVRFDTHRGVMRPLAELADALRQDLDWIREHTRLGEIATRWERRGRAESLLLRGDDLDAAKTWMAARNPAAPEITEAQRAFIKASEEAESARLDKEREQLKETVRQQRRIAWLLGGVAVLMGGSILGLIAWINQSHLEQLWYLNTREWPYKKAEFQPHILSAERERALKPKEIFRECEKDCPQMVLIPAGSFMMGSPESETGRLTHEGPQHKVTIAKPFAVSKFEVTWEEWDACAKYRGCPQDIPDSAWGHEKRPVINVTWEQVQQYVTWLSKMTGKSYRLLTEAEWEYAARAGANTAYSWGDEIGEGNANCSGCGSQWEDVQTAPVGSFAANPFGLNDMHGNVWEWVEDCYRSNYDGAPTDGSARISPDCTNHVVRGGSWIAWQVPRTGRSARGGSWVWVQVPQPARSASRDNYAKNNLRSFVGFRVARTLTP